MAVAAIMGDATAVALTAVGAVVVTGAVSLHLRESDADKDRIAHLQAAMPTFSASFDTDAARHLAPKPSAVLADVLKQQHAPLAPVIPIDRT